METKACQCEHASHFHEEERKPTPNGNPGHAYGSKFSTNYMVHMKTDLGTFHVCADCANDCLYAIGEEVRGGRV